MFLVTLRAARDFNGPGVPSLPHSSSCSHRKQIVVPHPTIQAPVVPVSHKRHGLRPNRTPPMEIPSMQMPAVRLETNGL